MDFFANLVGALPNSHIEQMIKMDKVLKDLGIDSHESHIASFMGREDYDAPEEFAKAVEFVIYQTSIHVIGMHGIRLGASPIGDRHSSKVIASILNGLFSLGSHENDDIVEEALDLYEDNNEIICHLLSKVEEIEFINLLEIIDYVDVDLINRLRNGLNDIEFNADNEVVTRELVEEYKAYMEDKEFGIIANSLMSVDNLPISFNATAVDLKPQLEQLPPKDLLEELWQLSIVSNMKEEFVENVNSVLIAYGKDTLYMTEVDAELYERGYDVEVL